MALLAASAVKNDSFLLLLAADHVVERTAAFTRADEEAKPLAAAGRLVSSGVRPTAPHTGYGDIKKCTSSGVDFDVDSFTENLTGKPR